MNDRPEIKKLNHSEIINQKKQFIFEVDQSSDYVFPNEVFNYYVYIKNISGTTIEHFKININNPTGVIFKEDNERPDEEICLKPDEVKLYEFKCYCQELGEHIIHFIGYGKGTQILYQTLKINCTKTYNSDTLLHRINIYDFTPYEDNYKMEATNYSNQVTQTFKRQKLPYKTGKQPFKLQKDKKIINGKPIKNENFVLENIESQSFLDQYNEAKNTQEHVYQYISRENFTEDAIESYTGKNLTEIFRKINENSEYFNGRLFRSGTNTLLNDFTQYAPNGFIYRMGLLNSEIYHTLGVIPTYSYMSDKLFRWAPSEQQLLDLIPKKKAMRWDENIWAGKGWIVHKVVTDEYAKTEEFAKKLADGLIIKDEIIYSCEDRRTAEEFVSKLEYWDDIERNEKKTDVVEYKYKIYESLYDTGVFYVNIPIDKIPSNFFLLEYKYLYALINRAKPYGTKPIINYVIKRTFNHHMDEILYLNYHKKTNFDMNLGFNLENISQYEYKNIPLICNGENKGYYPTYIPTNNVFSRHNFNYDNEINVDVDYSNVGMNNGVDLEIEENLSMYETVLDYRLKTIQDVLEVLYQGNYNTLSFRIASHKFEQVPYEEDVIEFSEITKNNLNIITLNNKEIEAVKTRVLFGEDTYIEITDSFDEKHEIRASYDKNQNKNFITYTYINKDNKKFIRERGYGDISQIGIGISKLYNKKILLFFVEDQDGAIHYFNHVIVQNIKSLTTNQKIKEGNEKNSILISSNFLNKKIIFETPYIKKSEIFRPKIIKGGSNWTNLYRLNDKNNSYSYIKNMTNNYLPVNDIILYYDQINIPETAIIESLRFKLTGVGSSSNKIYINKALNTNYIIDDMNGYNIQLAPKDINCYHYLKESSVYYQTKLNTAIEKEQTTLIENYTKLLEENLILNEDVDVAIEDYMLSPNDFIIINNPFWYELSDFSNLSFPLNEVENINFVIEGYNTEHESTILIETLSETNHSTNVKKKIPSGYFRKKIPVLYPNEFLLELLRLRFRFDKLNHDIKVFDTKIELKFKNKQTKEIEYEEVDSILLKNQEYITLLKDYYTPADINNGLVLKLSFDDLKPGDYYHINSTELEVIYKEMDIDMMINNNKYQNISSSYNKAAIGGETENAYLSGEFYNDVATMIQYDDNIGVNNKGIKLQDTLYQLFEARDDNITSIEIFPYGFRGNPDETLKIGLYTNSFNTPGKLIKEVCVSGWVKNNPDLRNLNRIKYNFNITNLQINEKYWFKIQVLNPEENSYYLLKGINNTKPGFKLLSDENNNYINTFSNLKFNIYSKNLSKSFNNIPVLQDYIDNPYILIGLHKGQGSINKLQVEKEKPLGMIAMSKVLFEEEPTIEVFKIIKKENGEETEQIIEGE